MDIVLYYLAVFNGLVGVLIVALLAASHVVPQTAIVGRLLIAWYCLIFCALYGVVASLALRCVGYGGLAQWTVARAFKHIMKFAIGVEFVVEDEHNLLTRPAVFIGNHQTDLDVLMLGCVFPKYCSVTAKKSLKYWPPLGWFMAASNTVFIDRGNRENARLAFDGAARKMNEERQSVYIFPEGTRSYAAKPEMLPFKKGAFHLAVQAQVPIVPIVVANYSNILHFQTMHFQPGDVAVKVLPPVSTEGLTPADVDALTTRVRDMMMRELLAITERTRGPEALGPPSASSSGSSVDDETANIKNRQSTKKSARN